MARVWIAEVSFSAHVRAKIETKHGLSLGEVREAVLYGNHRDARWHDHPEHGLRLIVRGLTERGIEVVAILLPPADDFEPWRCKTARRVG